MTLQQLKYLVTVAECKNITEAAEKLFISQPSLSAAIHNLEKEMGVTAFVRFLRTTPEQTFKQRRQHNKRG